MIGLYLHVPFCKNKCAYCNFYSHSADERTFEEYTQALCSHLKACKGLSLVADTLYLGGGTPSILGGKRIAKLVDTAKDSFGLENAQITVEVNPAVNLKSDLAEMFNAGVNRLSLGVQSAIKGELSALSRLHTNEDVIRTVRDAREIGFKDISLDLMIGIPHQTMDSLKESLDFLLSLSPTHISCYMLKVEQNTKFGKIGEANLKLPDEDTVCDMFLYVSEYWQDKGFNHYEISNFALDGFESKHNNKYWNCEEYLGLGPSAHSYLNGKRFYFENDIKEYIINPTPVFDGSGGDLKEYLMLRLRLSKGVIIKELNERFGYKLSSRILKKIDYYKSIGLMEQDENHFALTVNGFLVSNTIISDLLDNI